MLAQAITEAGSADRCLLRCWQAGRHGNTNSIGAAKLVYAVSGSPDHSKQMHVRRPHKREPGFRTNDQSRIFGVVTEIDRVEMASDGQPRQPAR